MPHFIEAMRALGLNPIQDKDNNRILFGRSESLDLATGKATLVYGRNLNELKRAYSKQVVLSQAKRQSMGVKQTSENKFQIIKVTL